MSHPRSTVVDMADEVMDGYPDIYDQLVDTNPLELRDRCRAAVAKADALCALLYDLSGCGGMDGAIEFCRARMDEASVLLMDAAIERGREIEHG